MSDTSKAPVHDEAHTGPIKTPGQLLTAVFFSFVAPVFIIIGLVFAVTSGNKTAPGASDTGQTTAALIQKVGTVEIRDANREMKGGEEVFKSQCSACHTSGAAGAPKLGDAAAWAPRIQTGYETLLGSALKGKGSMGAQGGGDYDDFEIARAVVYMTNASGGKLPEPQKPAAVAAAPAQ